MLEVGIRMQDPTVIANFSYYGTLMLLLDRLLEPWLIMAKRD